MKSYWSYCALMAVILSCTQVEAGGRRYRSSFTSKSNYTSRSNCANGQCSQVTKSSTVMRSSGRGNLQAWAEEEAQMMASRGTCGHVSPAPMGTFVGVGCGTTCQGSGVLVAEATYQGKTVRVWQR